jgi:hypothetical protein
MHTCTGGTDSGKDTDTYISPWHKAGNTVAKVRWSSVIWQLPGSPLIIIICRVKPKTCRAILLTGCSWGFIEQLFPEGTVDSVVPDPREGSNVWDSADTHTVFTNPYSMNKCTALLLCISLLISYYMFRLRCRDQEANTYIAKTYSNKTVLRCLHITNVQIIVKN